MAKTPSLKASVRLVFRACLLSRMLLLALEGEAQHMLQAMQWSGIARMARFPRLAPIHPRAWNASSRKCAADGTFMRSLAPALPFAGRTRARAAAGPQATLR